MRRNSDGRWSHEDPSGAVQDAGMNPGPTFERVYLALKEQVTGGRFAPGDHLEPAMIGDDLNASITPVRDALHRLVGERIVEAPRNDGFRVPAPTEAQVRAIYGWNGALLELALRRRPPRPGIPVPPGREGGEAWSDRSPLASAAGLFRQVARRPGDGELEAAIDNLSDRLGAMRIAERRLFEDLEVELDRLRTMFADGDWTALRKGIFIYHRRRQRFAPELLLMARLPRDPLAPQQG
jgi:hypothetical protein